MSSNDLVLRVIESLERHGVEYMLVGSYSSNAYGVARSTQDVDFVIELHDRSITPVFESLQPEIQFDLQMRLESVTATLRYVGKHPQSGFKIELFMVSDDPFDRQRFARRVRVPFLTSHAFLPTAEDVLIQKLRWYARGRRAKDLDDATSVLAVRRTDLDVAYIRRWCDQHGTRELFERLLVETGE